MRPAELEVRCFGTHQEMDHSRRSGRSTLQTSTHPRPYHMNHHPPSHHPPSPGHESEEERAENTPRRRIALACIRCRKRKIKCSGDDGHGQGCLNCKNAGQHPTECQFLRVNSEAATYVGGTNGASWAYSNAEPLLPLSAMSRAGSGIGTFAMATGTGLPRSNYGAGQFQSPFNNPSYANAPARQHYSHSFSLGDDPYDPNIMPPGMLDMQATTHPQSWTAIPDVGRSGNPALPFLSTAPLTISTVNADGSSTFPAMGSLATSLPGRTLPNPTSRMLQSGGSVLLSQGALSESNAPAIPPTLTPRTNSAWEQDHWTQRGNPNSTGLTSISSNSVADRPSGRISNEHVSRDSSSYASLLAPGGTAEAVSSPLSRYSPVNLVESTNSAANLRLPTTGFSTGQSSDSTLSSQASSENLYYNTYSMRSGLGHSSLTESMASEGTLGGFSYSSLPPPHQQQSSSFPDNSRRTSQETLQPHRTMMTSRS